MTSAKVAPSRLGFGCASLGSRVAPQAGLAALARAFERGVNWFDLAPSYGDGHAEDIFAQFGRSRRSQIYICTKCGIEPASAGVVAAALRPAARKLASAAPPLRKLLARGRAAPTRRPLSAALIRDSVVRSLKRLGTDYVDVLALHDPDPDELADEELRCALDDILARGQAKAIGIAGSLEAALAALALGLPVSHIQIANDPFCPRADALRRSAEAAKREIYLLTYSIFGGPGLVPLIMRSVRARPALAALLEPYGLPLVQAVRAALLDYARQSNSSGTILLSMFSPQHLDFNVERLRQEPVCDVRSFFDAVRAGLQAAAG